MAESNERIDISISIIECPICFQIMVNPRSLPCQHVLCLSCLAEYVAKRYEKNGELFPHLIQDKDGNDKPVLVIECMICKKESRYGTINAVESSLTHKKILNELPPPKTSDISRLPKCLFCQGGHFADLECWQCCNNFCKRCYSLSPGPGEMCREKHFTSKRLAGKSICKSHDIVLSYFCSQCNLPLCFDCYLDDHHTTGHKVSRIAAIGKEIEMDAMKCKLIADGNNSDLRKFEGVFEASKMSVEEALKSDLERLQLLELDVLGIVSVIFQNAYAYYDKSKEELKSTYDSQLLHLKELYSQDIIDGVNAIHDEVKASKDTYSKALVHRNKVSKLLKECNLQEKKIMLWQANFEKLKKEKISVFQFNKKEIFEEICNRVFISGLPPQFVEKPHDFYQQQLKENFLLKQLFGDLKEKEKEKQATRGQCAAGSPSRLSPSENGRGRGGRPFWQVRGRSEINPASHAYQHDKEGSRRRWDNQDSRQSRTSTLPRQRDQSFSTPDMCIQTMRTENSPAAARTISKSVRIRDPKSGKDVTDEVLKRT